MRLRKDVDEMFPEPAFFWCVHPLVWRKSAIIVIVPGKCSIYIGNSSVPGGVTVLLILMLILSQVLHGSKMPLSCIPCHCWCIYTGIHSCIPCTMPGIAHWSSDNGAMMTAPWSKPQMPQNSSRIGERLLLLVVEATIHTSRSKSTRLSHKRHAKAHAHEKAHERHA